MPWVSSEAMTLHLAEISKQVGASAHALLVCDGAGWHQPGVRLTVPDNVTLLRLPPYAPELNPMENVWAYMRGNQLSMTVWNSYTAILDACCDAWNSLMKDAERITSITARDWVQVKTQAGWYKARPRRNTTGRDPTYPTRNPIQTNPATA